MTTDIEIRVNLFDGILSGTYKPTNVLSFIVYYIAHYPNVKKKMSEEIDNIFQDGWMKILSQRRILNHVWTLVEDYDYAREEVSSAMIELVCLMALLFRKYEINLVENMLYTGYTILMVLVVRYSGIRSYKGNLKNVNDMHLCKVRVILGWQLSWTTPLKITIQGSHVPHNFPINNHEVTRINNLVYQTRDMVFKDIMLIINKVKILAPLNGASEEKIGEALNNQQNLCSKNPNESENSPAKYYQLTVSDEMEEILSEGLYTSTLDDVMSMNKHVTYFKDKQRVLPSSNKNLLIYNGSVAYQEIIRLYNLQDICPFCDEILPNPMPYKTKLVLDQLNKIKHIISSFVVQKILNYWLKYI
ncbi:hypothetical protein GLOIN_2v1481389 [Rhizophagus irregularis DAOM 181602=DAOM 197198]|uniref:Uncharacterized protein n=1 Tax=Rhizophagus irregularis (strain DAOM 181602 / DAOM 197198 / MUCL 43194) TaxID=747089 RepID=A0A2P4PQJ1_RHIID|nr:hypothetical protein GLOIN_2v1481389 [Rhizophagus irregularis DAOM 181602=DAOM 197198]POG67659.1 hypothetical protein GLOIN_2v1481389 [Rhizophagus irregularis DAOM 181602=DAOM 197198]|eukprot:XP_025174525.1 hypothetical protein GLOIN_2v1481389 [Rhizophagus irregularis DAOM 181602=DAOM 197198]